MARKNVLITLGVSAASAAGASAITWFLAQKRLEEQYEDRLQEEIRVSVNFILKEMGINNVIVTDEDPDIVAARMNEEAADERVSVIVAEQGYDSALASEEPEPEVERVFGSQEDKPPLEDLAQRNQTTPYHKVLTPDEPEVTEEDFPEPPPENPDITVISRDIFLENPNEWQQDTITYFADDGVLDVELEFIENHEELIGPGKPRFGETSGDPKVVYVRNKKLMREFEIISDPGNASEFLAHSLGEMYKPGWAR